jgi:dTDP-4-amino-4,6-dideoxygalactose transaminase
VRELVWQTIPSEVTANSWYLMIGRVRGGCSSRAKVAEALAAARVPFTPFYPRTLYQNAAFRDVACRVCPCPAAEAALQDAFWLPHRVLLANRDTIASIGQIFRESLS